MNTTRKDLVYEFDGFRVEVGQRCLWHGDELVPLTAKAFDTLLVLVENNGRLVEKDELLNEVWANTFVEESTLAQNISTLRKAFAAQQNGTQFIETVPRRGYRFVRDVHQAEDEGELYLIERRTSTRVLAEKTEIHDTDPPPFAATAVKYLSTHKIHAAAGIIVGVLSIFGIALAVRQLAGTTDGRERFAAVSLRSLYSRGDVSRLAVSPDGKYVAAVENKDGKQRLTVRQVDAASSVELTPASEDEFLGVTFSPGGESVYYSMYQTSLNKGTNARIGVLFKVAILGGPSTEIVRDIDGPVAISANGNKLAFVRLVPKERISTVVVIDMASNTTNEKAIASRPARERFSVDGLSWSPDDKNIAVAALSDRDPDRSAEIAIVNAESGEQSYLTPEPWMWVGEVSWLRDGSGVLFPAYGRNSANVTDEIWIASFPDGKTRRVTDGINGVFGISTTADSRSVAAVRSSRTSGLWVRSETNPGTATIINKSIGDFSLAILGLDWTPDGKIVYGSATDSNANIWIVDSDGYNLKQLTSHPKADYGPVVSPDGNYVVFISHRGDGIGIWRMNIDGTNVRELSKVSDSASPSISPDGNWVYFSGLGKQNSSVLWRVPISGGEPEQLTERACLYPQISPDGQFISAFFPQQSPDGTFVNALRPTILTVDGKQVMKQFLQLDRNINGPLLWTADGKNLSFAIKSKSVSNIWTVQTDGDLARQVTNFETDEIFRYRWSRDGKMLAFEKGMRICDLLLITDTGL